MCSYKVCCLHYRAISDRAPKWTCLRLPVKVTDMDGKEIFEERTRRGLSQRALAEKMSVSESTISNWETGRTSAGRSLTLLRDVFASIPPKARAISNGASDDGLSLTRQQQDGLLRALRNIRESTDEAVKILGG